MESLALIAIGIGELLALSSLSIYAWFGKQRKALSLKGHRIIFSLMGLAVLSGSFFMYVYGSLIHAGATLALMGSVGIFSYLHDLKTPLRRQQTIKILEAKLLGP